MASSAVSCHKAPVTITDIAREVGVSHAAVSKVLGGGAGNIRVGKEKAERIRETARRLNYRPNLSARALSSHKSNLIGVLIDTQAPQPHYQLLAQIEQASTKRGYRILMGEIHDDVDSLHHHYRNFLQYNADGVICISHDYPGWEDKLRDTFEQPVNVVFINRPVFKNASYVHLDIETALLDATRRLCAARQRVGILTASTAYSTIRERLDGYRRGIELSGRAYDPSLVHSFPFTDACMAASGDLERIVDDFVLPARLDALITSNDLVAASMIRFLIRRGVRVPDDVAVLGGNNEPFTQAFIPTISTFDHRNDVVGRYAVDMLLDLIESGTPGEVRTATTTPELIVRESTGPLPPV